MLLAQVQDSPELQGQRIIRVNLQRMGYVLSGFGVTPALQCFACLVCRGLGFMWRLQLVRRHDGLLLPVYKWFSLPHRRNVVHLCGSSWKREGLHTTPEQERLASFPSPPLPH